MRGVAFIFLCFLTQSSFAQFPSESWHEGKVVLLSGDTLIGAVKYNLDRDIIQLNDTKTIEAYTARKVLFFTIFDKTVSRHRQFYAIPYNVTIEYKTPIFFEVLYEGKLTFLGREYITIQTTSYGPALGSGSYSRRVLSFRYYFLDANGKITLYSTNKKELLNYMSKYRNDVNAYMKKNRLHYDDKEDLIYIVQYYNTLINPKN
ncbi:MAG: hypothetical protein OEX22_12155 [Cyclobacteriaceae bacterium]|nr:hypothetical protein [Cyclobacteriaceae bacterium]